MFDTNIQEGYMRFAIKLAKEAAKRGEVPIGCVIIGADGTIVGSGSNSRETSRNSLAHAEIAAINEACTTLNSWRLEGCTAYVTLEPCPMCYGAFAAARIDRVIYGATNSNPKAAGGDPELQSGILAEDCAELLTDFFAKLRTPAP
ncbi:MAG: nucleoside deaminase [Oscillospiraceae bacterium]|jgi:tRNA(adenine34) deaminase|nr:nucleoside deaminase [Oscillospiraceae bacterium]